jgi:hypothetical protein
MSQIVESIVSEIANQQEAEKQQKTQKYQNLLGTARIELQAVLEHIPGLYETLKPYIGENYRLINNWRDEAVELTWTIQSDELQLAPITLHLQKPAGGYQTAYISIPGCNQREFSKIREAIALARTEYVEWKVEENKKFESDRTYKFNFWGQRDEQVMHTAYAELVARFPERQPEFDQKRQEWLKDRAGYEKSEEEDRQRKADEDQAKDEFLTQMIAYFQKDVEIKDHNMAKAETIQVALDQPFNACQLTYAIVSNLEGEPYVETATKWVTGEFPNDKGYWTTFQGDEFIFFYPVSVEKFQVLPSEKRPGLYKSIRRSEYDIEFIAHPHVDVADLNRQIDEAGFEKLPKKPSRSDLLSWHTLEDIEKKAYRAVYKQDQDQDDLAF